MTAKVDLRVEILDGEDKGYVLEEHNKIVELYREELFGTYIPYRITIRFITDELMRKMLRKHN